MPVLGTIRQAGDVLELFNRSHPEWGVRQVARTLEIPKSNAHQLLSSLEPPNWDFGTIANPSDSDGRIDLEKHCI